VLPRIGITAFASLYSDVDLNLFDDIDQNLALFCGRFAREKLGISPGSLTRPYGALEMQFVRKIPPVHNVRLRALACVVDSQKKAFTERAIHDVLRRPFTSQGSSPIKIEKTPFKSNQALSSAMVPETKVFSTGS